MMKKCLALLLTTLLLCVALPAALAAPEAESETELSYPEESERHFCGTDPEVMDELFSNLLNKKAEELGLYPEDSPASRATMPNWWWHTLPSTGEVHMLVIPVAYSDYPDYKESFDPQRLQDQFFAPYVPDQPMREQSVRAFYYQSSYGKLDLTGTVLPIYDAPQTSEHYGDAYPTAIPELIKEALSYHMAQGLDLSQYDSDGDGVLDGVILKSLRPEDRSDGWHYVYSCGGTSTVGEYRVEAYMYSAVKKIDDGAFGIREVYKHETGHLLGLPDHYSRPSQSSGSHNTLPSNTEELMLSYYYYINAYYKYLLGWIDPVILTGKDAIKPMALAPVEPLENPDGLPRAAVLVPHGENFPFGEYYVAEYRAGGFDRATSPKSFFTQNPGVVIWHCDTAVDPLMHYTNSTSYLKPVHKSGAASYGAQDIYTAGDAFSQDTTPSSTFYTGAHSGAFLKVDSLTPERATLQIGLADPGPQIVISEYGSTAIKSGQTWFTLSYMDGWEPLSPDNEFFHRAGGLNYTVTKTSAVPGEELNIDVTLRDHPTATNQQKMYISRIGMSGKVDGTIRIEIPAGEIQSNGRASPAVASAVLYVDHTPPVLTLKGDDPMILAKGEKFVDPGVWVTDNLDPRFQNDTIQYAYANETQKVDTATPGTYTISYVISDHAGNRAEPVTRTVIVDSHSHSYGESWQWDEFLHWHACTVCGELHDRGSHLWDTGTQTVPPTEEQDGLRVYACTVCGATKTEPIPALITFIRTAQELRNAADEISGGSTSGYYRLAADIDLNGEPWTPIKSFSGVFDGNGHKITGLRVNSSTGSAGLFAINSGLIQNLGIYGEMTGSAANAAIGGIVATNTGTIRNCYNACSIMGERTCGGIAANNTGLIENCYNIGLCMITQNRTGQSIGGIVGHNLIGTVFGCYNAAEITGSAANIGSLVGNNGDRGTITACYYLSDTSAAAVGNGDNTGTEEKDREGFSSESSFPAWDFSTTWYMSGSLGRPILRNAPEVNEGHVHSFPDTWSSDGARHWRQCACGERANEGDHTAEIDPEIKASCVKPGKTEGSHCPVCSRVLSAQTELPALSHDYASTWSYNKTHHWHACRRCGSEADKAVHKEDSGTITKAPTPEAEGTKIYCCTVCGLLLREESLPKLHIHSFPDSWSSDDFKHWRQCSCGETDKGFHLWDEGLEIQKPTETQIGRKLHTCRVCAATKVKLLPILVSYIYIHNAEELRNVAAMINSDDVSYRSSHYKLTADIDLGGEPWTPIENFSGTFEGNGHKITGLRIVEDEEYSHHAALFANTDHAGLIQNLGVYGEVTGRISAGIVAINVGTIRNCYSACSVTGTSRCGGIAASNNYLIENCYNLGPCTYIGNGQSGYVGGIAGATTINSQTLNCYNIADISNGVYSGGIVGQLASKSTVAGCYYLSGTSAVGIGSGNSTGAQEKTLEELKTTDSFQNWDFSEIWVMNSDLGRPVFYEIAEDHFSDTWSSDDSHHWHACPCGNRADESPHDWDSGSVIQQPTVSATGTRLYTCGICAATKEETIPAEQPPKPPTVGGGSSGGGSSATYPILIPEELVGGHLGVARSKAPAGERVIFSATPAEGFELQSLEAVDGKGRAVALTLLADGKYSFVMPAEKVTLRALFSPLPPPPESQGQRLPFEDVSQDAWYHDAVAYVYENGLMNGTKREKLFNPELPMSRAMLMTVLARYGGVDTSGGESWFSKGVAWAAASGISSGEYPDADLTREQLVTMLWRYVGEPDSTQSLADFPDAASAGKYAVPALQWAVEKGILTGKRGNLLDPKAPATRAEVAAILTRFCEWEKEKQAERPPDFPAPKAM